MVSSSRACAGLSRPWLEIGRARVAESPLNQPLAWLNLNGTRKYNPPSRSRVEVRLLKATSLEAVMKLLVLPHHEQHLTGVFADAVRVCWIASSQRTQLLRPCTSKAVKSNTNTEVPSNPK